MDQAATRVAPADCRSYFGELGVRQSSAQITTHYEPRELEGRQVIAVTNLAPRRIAGFTSEVLVLGAMLPNGQGVILLRPDRQVRNGCPIA